MNALTPAIYELYNTIRKTFLSKFFVIGEDYDASVYAEFINELMNNPKKYQMIREEQNWTKEGELIRMVDYIEIDIDEEPVQRKKNKKIKIDPILAPKSKPEPEESTKVIVEGSTHYKEVDIGVVSDE